jgi:hypothetical protein
MEYDIDYQYETRPKEEWRQSMRLLIGLLIDCDQLPNARRTQVHVDTELVAILSKKEETGGMRS